MVFWDSVIGAPKTYMNNTQRVVIPIKAFAAIVCTHVGDCLVWWCEPALSQCGGSDGASDSVEVEEPATSSLGLTYSSNVVNMSGLNYS